MTEEKLFRGDPALLFGNEPNIPDTLGQYTRENLHPAQGMEEIARCGARVLAYAIDKLVDKSGNLTGEVIK